MQISIKNLIPPLLLSCALSASLCYINGELVILMFALYSLVAFPITAISINLIQKTISMHAKNKQEKMLIEGLYQISYYRKSGWPMYQAILKAAASSESGETSEILKEIARRIRLGGDFGTALQAVSKRKKLTLLENICSTDQKGYGQIAKMLNTYESSNAEKGATIDYSMQRYATINMFVSTILPSFIIFAFIGETILSPGTESLFAFSIVVTLMLPLVYLAGNAFMWRRLLG